MLNIEEIIECVHKPQNLERIKTDAQRYYIYNGKLKDIIREAIQREFLLPETVSDMASRIIPINITQKITAKLAKVYNTTPVRRPMDGNEDDLDILDFYVNEMDYNRKMNHANNMFKLCKHVALEPFLSSDGQPKVRVLPSHTYTLYSDDAIDPTKITHFIKHLNFDIDKSKQVHEIWSDEDFVIVNGEGTVLFDKMLDLNNPEGINTYGILPFTVIRETDDLLMPIQDDDLINMQVAICLLLTDLAFATKYASWGVFYTIGLGEQKISFNPNSVIMLDHTPGTDKPEIGTIKSELDSDAMLRQVEALVSMLLTTKSLSVGQISGQIQATNPASGIAKVLDQAETTEEREVQVSYFQEAEKEYWYNYAHFILPIWIQSGSMDVDFVKPFSQDFELSIQFPPQQVILGENEKVDLLKKKLDMGLISFRDAIKQLNPTLTDIEIDSHIAGIQKEKVDNVKFMQRNLVAIESKPESEEDDNGDIEDQA